MKRVAALTVLAAAVLSLGWQAISSPTAGHTEEHHGSPQVRPSVNQREISVRDKPAPADLPRHPNIVFILSDDQRAGTLGVMPKLERLLVDRGTDFTNAVVSNSLCCPSRATILTGNYSHTTHIYLNHGPDGGGPAFQRFGDDRSTIATWLHAAGYTTALYGKYLNGYHAPYVPPGWSVFDGFNYGEQYWGGELSEDGHVVTFPKTAYSTTYLGQMAVRFIERQSPRKPFFLYYAPYAPHLPADPAPRYAGMRFGGLAHRVRSDPAYYPREVTGAPPYVRHAPPDNPRRNANAYRYALHQFQTLQSVDDEVANIVAALRKTGRLEDTVIIYTSDNGVMWGEHRMIPASKSVPYEGAIHVPLVIRWDATRRRGIVDHDLVANVDFAATIAQLAGVPHPFTEGPSFESLITGRGPRWRQRPVLVEHEYDTGEWKIGKAPGFCAVRTPRYMFAHYSRGFEEMYNLRTDPYEMHNIVHTDPGTAARLRAETNRLCRPRPPKFRWR